MVYGKPTFCMKLGGYLETTKDKLNSIHINRSNIFNDLKNKINCIMQTNYQKWQKIVRKP